MCIPKYLGVLSSDIAPATYDHEITTAGQTCKPEISIEIRGVETNHPHPKTTEKKESVEDTKRERLCSSSLTNNKV
ncbi:hypothetical protein TNCV_3463541 [Trichonephila clavipes]|nr:hypothetical protein TNCV_3463541 [Trichonephila clavipes]